MTKACWIVTGLYDPSPQVAIDSGCILIPVQNILGLKARSMEDIFGMFRSVSDAARTHGGNKQISQTGEKGNEPQRRVR